MNAPSNALVEERKRVHIIEHTVTERYYFDPAEIAEKFNWDEIKDHYRGSFEDFVIETFEQHQGSLFANHWFYDDANPSVGVEIIERWDDE